MIYKKVLVPKEKIGNVEIKKVDNNLFFSLNGKTNVLYVTPKVNVELTEEGLVFFIRKEDYEASNNSERKFFNGILGTLRAIAVHKIEGLITPFKVRMNVVGTGYKAELQGDRVLVLTIGLSNPKVVPLPSNVNAQIATKESFILTSHDKEQLNNFVNHLVKIKKRIDVYKGTGIFPEGYELKLKEINKK